MSELTGSLREMADTLVGEAVENSLRLAADRIAALEAQLAEARAVLPCGHHHSLLLKSAETGGEPLYCSMCDCMSQRDDANEECGYRIKERDEARAEVERYKPDAERFEWTLGDPETARHLLLLLQQGRGDKTAYRNMIDRIRASKNAARSQP